MFHIVRDRFTNSTDLHFKLVGFAEAEGLNGAIEKWTTMAEFLDANPEVILWDRGIFTCPLCAEHPGCGGCIIAEDTGQDGCNGTPYHNYCDNPTAVNAWAMAHYLEGLL